MNVITLSSIPPRFGTLHHTLNSLVRQTARIDRVILYVPQSYRRFPDWDGPLPQVPEGVELIRTDEDFGPATKVLPAIRAFRGQDVNLIFCDDDRVYPPGWAAALLDEGAARPGCAITISFLHIADLRGFQDFRPVHRPRASLRPKHRDVQYRLRRIWQQLDVLGLYSPPHKPARQVVDAPGYADIFEGVNGVLVRPEYFPDDVFDIPQVVWAVDDCWLSGHVARMGIPIWATDRHPNSLETAAHHTTPLHTASLDGHKRDEANLACVRYFRETHGIWR